LTIDSVNVTVNVELGVVASVVAVDAVSATLPVHPTLVTVTLVLVLSTSVTGNVTDGQPCAT